MNMHMHAYAYTDISVLFLDADDIEDMPEMSGKKKLTKPSDANSHGKLTATNSVSGGIFPINNQRSVKLSSSSQKGRRLVGLVQTAG